MDSLLLPPNETVIGVCSFRLLLLVGTCWSPCGCCQQVLQRTPSPPEKSPVSIRPALALVTNRGDYYYCALLYWAPRVAPDPAGPASHLVDSTLGCPRIGNYLAPPEAAIATPTNTGTTAYFRQPRLHRVRSRRHAALAAAVPTAHIDNSPACGGRFFLEHNGWVHHHPRKNERSLQVRTQVLRATANEGPVRRPSFLIEVHLMVAGNVAVTSGANLQ